MNTKHIIALVTFVVTFAGSAVLVRIFRPVYSIVVPSKSFVSKGCMDSAAGRITSLLQQDIENGRVQSKNVFAALSGGEQNFDGNSMIVYAAETEIYTSKLENLNAADLPMEFRTALDAHKRAWRVQADFLNDVSRISGSRFSDVRSSPTFLSNDYEITRTWYEVLAVAKRNGAVIPPNAY